MSAEVKNYADFGRLIRTERMKRGWTQIQLYMRVNELSKKEQAFCLDSIKCWEVGKSIPKIEAVLALSKVFKMPELIGIRVNIIELERRKYNDICAESRSEAQEAVAQSAAV